MSNHKRWVQRGGGEGEFFKWETPGQTVEGLWKGQRDGKFGALGIMETKEGPVVFPIHTALVYLVERLVDGDEVRIVYNGKVVNPKSGREYKAFDLFVAEVESDAAPA